MTFKQAYKLYKIISLVRYGVDIVFKKMFNKLPQDHFILWNVFHNLHMLKTLLGLLYIPLKYK